MYDAVHREVPFAPCIILVSRGTLGNIVPEPLIGCRPQVEAP
jgi:hypothetical protein